MSSLSRVMPLIATSMLYALPSRAQQLREAAPPPDAQEPEHMGIFEIGVSFAPPQSILDTNTALGHSGASFRVEPLMTLGEWGTWALPSMSLRWDAVDDVYEAGTSLMLSMMLRREGWAGLYLHADVGFEHLGVTSSELSVDAPSLSSRMATTVAVGVTPGDWHLSWSMARRDQLDWRREETLRHWTESSLRARYRIGSTWSVFGDATAQWWQITAPGDVMEDDSLSLIYRAGIEASITDGLAIGIQSGVRQDHDSLTRHFLGTQLTWRPTFGGAEGSEPMPASRGPRSPEP